MLDVAERLPNDERVMKQCAERYAKYGKEHDRAKQRKESLDVVRHQIEDASVHNSFIRDVMGLRKQLKKEVKKQKDFDENKVLKVFDEFKNQSDEMDDFITMLHASDAEYQQRQQQRQQQQQRCSSACDTNDCGDETSSVTSRFSEALKERMLEKMPNVPDSKLQD